MCSDDRDRSVAPWLRGYSPDGMPLSVGETVYDQLLATAAALDEDRTVGRDTVQVDGEPVVISTVFLVMDANPSPEEHVPELYETMTIREGSYHLNGRCTSRAAAQTLHAEVVALAAAGVILG